MTRKRTNSHIGKDGKPYYKYGSVNKNVMTEEQNKAIELEAEKLYPFDINSDSMEYCSLLTAKRRGYIAAAKKYTAEIETLKATTYTLEEIEQELLRWNVFKDNPAYRVEALANLKKKKEGKP